MMNDTILGGVICIAISSATGIPAAWQMWHGRRSATWPSATGRVVSSVIDEAAFTNSDSSSHPGGAFCRLKVRYSFEVAGQHFEGSRLFFGDTLWGWTKSRNAVEAEARGYPPGGPINIYYSPKQPNRSTLTTGIVADLAWLNLAFAGVFLLAGVGVVLGWVKVA